MPTPKRDHRLQVHPAYAPNRRRPSRPTSPTSPTPAVRSPSAPALSHARNRMPYDSAGALRPITHCDCVCTCTTTSRPLRPESWLVPTVATPPYRPNHPLSHTAPSVSADLERGPGIPPAIEVPLERPRRYDTFASAVSFAAGTSWCFYGAVIGVIIWGILGKPAHGSDTWQLVLNTTSSIITMLLGFILLNTVNRDTRVLHVQLQRQMTEIQTLRALLQTGAPQVLAAPSVQAPLHVPGVRVTAAQQTDLAHVAESEPI